jgi:hypothetical protein
MSAILLFLLHFFGPEPPIVVARDTTYITEPLRPNGLPDYEKYILEQSRKGMTPDNNAAALLFQALWPNELDPRDYEPMRAELGLNEIPPASTALQLVYGDANKKRVLDWLREQHRQVDENDLYDWIGPATESAWASQQFPPLAEWVNANRKPLDLIVLASRRPRFYSPSPTMLAHEHIVLIAALLPGTQNMREAERGLSARAMWHIGENRLNDAWSDLLAIHRLARLAAQGHKLVEQAVAMNISGAACKGTLVLLSSDHITVELARQINQDLAGLVNVTSIVDSLDHFDRLETLDAIIHVTHDGPVASLVSENPLKRFLFWITPINMNIVLRHVNQWYDRFVEVAKLQNRSDQKREYAKIEADLAREAQATKDPANFDAAIFSRTRKSKLIASFVCTLFLTIPNETTAAELRSRTTFQLTRLAAALAVFRAERRAYPAKLDELVPSMIKKLPVDIYNAKPFLYQRLGEGYLLYSVGENGVDDGGSYQDWHFKGQSLDELKNSDPKYSPPQIPAGADDISIRVPRPPFKLPKASQSVKQQ